MIDENVEIRRQRSERFHQSIGYFYVLVIVRYKDSYLILSSNWTQNRLRRCTLWWYWQESLPARLEHRTTRGQIIKGPASICTSVGGKRGMPAGQDVRFEWFLDIPDASYRAVRSTVCLIANHDLPRNKLPVAYQGAGIDPPRGAGKRNGGCERDRFTVSERCFWDPRLSSELRPKN